MKILVIPGDGIGPEIVGASVQVLEALRTRFGLDLELEYADCGLDSLARRGVTLADDDFDRARAADGVILGPMSVSTYPPPAEGGINVPSQFRTRLGLFANVRPSYTRPGVPSVAKNMDLIFVRENLEDFYADRNMYQGIGEMMLTPDVAICIGKITAEGTRRAAQVAFELASRRPRRKVTLVHKQVVLKLYHGLFVQEAMKVAEDFPDVTVESLYVDAVAAHLVKEPERFDVMLAPNMYGDILTDQAAALAGSLGLASSLNIGADSLVANAGHGSGLDIAGKDIANPTSMLHSVVLLLDEIGFRAKDQKVRDAAEFMKQSVDAVLGSADGRTRDLGGSLGTKAFGERVVARIRDKATA